MAKQPILDVIGVGIGPFNLGMAALLEKTDCRSLFFEKKPTFEWHPGMLLEGTTLQVPFMADVVTMADPTSPYSFLNYLHEQQRLYQFYFFEKFQIPRSEYNHYCQWTASKLEELRFGCEVENIELGEDGVYQVTVFNHEENERKMHQARHVVMGTGTRPSVPKSLRASLEEKVFHSSQYKQKSESVLNEKSITVVGSGQSAAEIFYDLLQKQPDYEYQLAWYTRSKGFYPMEYSKLGLEHFSPDYTKYFYGLDAHKKQQVLKNQALLYKGISAGTIADIYDLLYERTACGRSANVQLQALTEVTSIEKQTDGYSLSLYQVEEEKAVQTETGAVILATGYESFEPDCIEGLNTLLERDDNGQLVIEEDYRVRLTTASENHVFIQNGELHTHGVGAPDLGLGAFRNATIINQIAGKEVYKTYDNQVFQTFGINNDTRKDEADHGKFISKELARI
ncbi:lysine N6-hydroxylase [Bacillus ectoiniformans]|nr:lysine N(6)-hydroxylase/L-ornithine N(5)-oxygenase family protein [Bacillus ectoiniformans]MBM7649157.1 lysine N6-hydroxylase [Bacillus ectoiniformans]